jgi:hypothetical protein
MGSCFLWHSELTEAEARGEKEPEEQPLINPGISPYRPLGVPPYPQQPFIYSGTSISTSGPLNPTQPNKIVIDGKEIDLSELKAWNKAPMSWSINYQSVQP